MFEIQTSQESLKLQQFAENDETIQVSSEPKCDACFHSKLDRFLFESNVICILEPIKKSHPMKRDGFKSFCS